MTSRIHRHARYSVSIVAIAAMTLLSSTRLMSQPTTVSDASTDRQSASTVLAAPVDGTPGTPPLHHSRHALPNGQAFPVVELGDIGYIELDSIQATQIGITYGPDYELIFGYTYLFGSKPKLGDAALRALPFSEAISYGMRDSGLVEQIWINKHTISLRPTREFRPGVIGTAWRYLTDARGYKIAARYAADTGNVRYTENGAVYMWMPNRLVDETTMDATRRTALKRTWYEMSETAYEQEINSWIPISVPRPMVGSGGTTSVIFWCEPTAELLAALPPSDLAELRIELLAIANSSRSNDRTITSLQTWADEILDRIDALEAVQIKLISSQAKLEIPITALGRRWQSIGPVSIGWQEDRVNTKQFRLTASTATPRTVSIRLLYWHGMKAFDLVEKLPLKSTAEALDMQIPLNVPSGIYQLEVTTNMNETVTRRVLVERGTTPMRSGYPWPAPMGDGAAK